MSDKGCGWCSESLRHGGCKCAPPEKQVDEIVLVTGKDLLVFGIDEHSVRKLVTLAEDIKSSRADRDIFAHDCGEDERVIAYLKDQDSYIQQKTGELLLLLCSLVDEITT